MSFKASDLPYSVKRDLLKQIENQLGWSKYHALIQQHGEDGLIDLILAHATVASRPRINPWQKARDAVNGLFKSIFETGSWVYLIWGIASAGWAGIAIAIGVVLLIYFSAAFYYSIGGMRGINAGLSWLIGAAISLGGIALVGYLLWLGIPWLINGMFQWWGWLGGHFR